MYYLYVENTLILTFIPFAYQTGCYNSVQTLASRSNKRWPLNKGEIYIIFMGNKEKWPLGKVTT